MGDTHGRDPSRLGATDLAGSVTHDLEAHFGELGGFSRARLPR
jgi:hypothetical protein